MRKVHLAFYTVLQLLITNSFAQQTTDKEKLIKVDLLFGSNFRITPIETKVVPIVTNGITGYPTSDYQKTLTGFGFTFSTEIYINKIGLGVFADAGFKYDQMYYTSNLDTIMPNNPKYSKPVTGFIGDFCYGVEKKFKIKKDNIITLKLGGGWMHLGTDFMVTYAHKINGIWFWTSEKNSFAYRCTDFAVSYKRNKWMFTLTGYYASQHHFDTQVPFVLPEFRISYQLR